jgi:hypothetical protein
LKSHKKSSTNFFAKSPSGDFIKDCKVFVT